MLADAQNRPGTGDDLLHKSLAAYFVPFRSPSFKELVRPQESLAFALELWQDLFRQLDPQLVITIDLRTTDCLTHILQQKLGETPSREKHPVGWGEYTSELVSFGSGSSARAILRFPHLSHFKVFGRSKSEPHLKRIVKTAVSRVF